jgi:hypothetical protein
LLKVALRGCRFADDEVVKYMVHMELHMQPKTFFADGIRKLLDQSIKCMEKLWDYIKK